MMKNINYKFNANGTTFRNLIAELLSEYTLNNEDSKKVRKEILNFLDKTKKEI